MNWRVEIRTYDAETITHKGVVDKVESTDINVVKRWLNERWLDIVNGTLDYSMQVYANNKELDFLQICDLGFLDKIKLR